MAVRRECRISDEVRLAVDIAGQSDVFVPLHGKFVLYGYHSCKSLTESRQLI